jgi:NAD dependent epimerase/dehydratase family enzyme
MQTARMSSEPQRPVVAIAGATGSLGQHITETLLEPAFFSQLSSIVLLSRKKQEESRQLQEWAGKGAKVVVYDEKDLAGSLTGVDVLINV